MTQDFYDNEYCASFQKDDRKIVSRIFLYLTISLMVPYLFLILVGFAVNFFPGVTPAFMLIINDSYTVLVILLFSFLTRKITSRRPVAMADMTMKKFFFLACASVPLMLIGALVGNVISSFFGKILERDVANALETLVEDYPFGLVFISVIIAAPVFEELMFRKILIDKLSRFGFSFSVLVSGLVFGSFHGNFYQLFYGCLLGFLLAFIYCMYAKVRYCIALHSLINFIGFVCPIYLEKFFSSSYIILNFVALFYSFFYYICIVFGIIVIIFGIKTILAKYPTVLSAPKRHLFYKNFGMALYLFFITVIIAFSLLV